MKQLLIALALSVSLGGYALETCVASSPSDDLLKYTVDCFDGQDDKTFTATGITTHFLYEMAKKGYHQTGLTVVKTPSGLVTIDVFTFEKQ